ncbi:MAG: hypothetical protein DIU56_004910 [Pseudomonadota bacterium]|jgi:hypothetical protein
MELLEIVVVAVIVAAAASFSIWRLLPVRQRLRLIDRLSPQARHGTGLLGRVRRKLQEELTHGCGACAAGTPRTHRAHRPR